jgi:hypothetical protein
VIAKYNDDHEYGISGKGGYMATILIYFLYDHEYGISGKGGYMATILIYFLYVSSVKLLSDGSLDVDETNWLCTSKSMTIENIEDALILIKCKYILFYILF